MTPQRAGYGAPLLLVLALSCAVAYAAPPTKAPAPPPAVDDDFLEFLGTVDSEPIRPEDLWLVDYWSKKPAPNPGTSTTPPPAAKPAPPAPKPSPQNSGQNNGQNNG